MTNIELREGLVLGSIVCVNRDELQALRNQCDDWQSRCLELETALKGILDIGKRDMSNPKYDGYFQAAIDATKQKVSNEIPNS